jgi:diacylglycerol kinase (ATP)
MWAIVINPISGKGKGAKLGKEVVAYFAKHDLKYEIVTGNSSHQTAMALDNFLNRFPEARGVLSVGGDGLAHLVLQKVVPRKIAFAILPGGTGNDFSRTIGWDQNKLTSHLDAITTTSPRAIDLGIADGEWFGAILSSGFDSVVNERANSLTWPKGPSRYNIAIALELPKFKARKFEITIDERTLSTDAMLVAVGNGQSYGGGMLVCPEASIHDGLFDVMVLKPISTIEFIRVFPQVYKGSHVHHPEVEVHRARKVRIEAKTTGYADGERIGALPISAECVSGAGRTWLP